jgi:hypothetical protein
MRVSSLVPKVIQQLLTSSSSSSCHFYLIILLNRNYNYITQNSALRLKKSASANQKQFTLILPPHSRNETKCSFIHELCRQMRSFNSILTLKIMTSRGSIERMLTRLRADRSTFQSRCGRKTVLFLKAFTLDLRSI